MVSEMSIPEQQMHLFEKHTLLFLTGGTGMFQVDFRNYTLSDDKAVFLSPGQYIKVLFGDFNLSIYEFPSADVNQIDRSRYLFKHLVSLGHIDLKEEKAFYLKEIKTAKIKETTIPILVKAIDDWVKLNPFNATESDVNLLFDIKEIVDERFRTPISVADISKPLKQKNYIIQQLTRNKLQLTINRLKYNKLLLESQRKVVFTNLSTKEIAYDMGFKDPNYFNRFFKEQTNRTPYEFRQQHEFDLRDTFVTDLMLLIEKHYKQPKPVSFYASHLFIAPLTLNRKISDKLNTTLVKLINNRRMQEAIMMLKDNIAVNAIAWELGFEEPNHFSAFFKKHNGKSPTQFMADFQKVQSLDNFL